MGTGRISVSCIRALGSRALLVLGCLIAATASAAAAPDLTISKSHVGDFQQGQHGAVYTITVTNVGDAPTTGTVTVIDTLPSGMAGNSMSGTGWSCATSARRNARAATPSPPETATPTSR